MITASAELTTATGKLTSTRMLATRLAICSILSMLTCVMFTTATFAGRTYNCHRKTDVDTNACHTPCNLFDLVYAYMCYVYNSHV